MQQLQQQLQSLRTSNAAPHQPASAEEGFEFWKVSRNEVEIREEIGRGAWGYVAKGKFRCKTVAVKCPHTEILDHYIFDRLKREIRIMAQVRHPNLLLFIAAVFDEQAKNLQSPPLIITELLDINLRSAYKRNLLGSSQTSIFIDVACALNYLHLHREPILHRDVSAPNVLLEALANGIWKAKLSDFGSANLARIASTLAEGAMIYIAPEAIPRDPLNPSTPQPLLTPKVDVYSYGVLLCEVVTRQMPLRERLPSLLQLVGRDQPQLHGLVRSCTSYNPDTRPSMENILEQLQ